MRLRRFYAAIIIAMIMLTIGCVESDGMIQIDPDPDITSTQEEHAVLYFGDSTGNYLVPEFRLIDRPANQSVEEYIVKALVEGPDDELGGKQVLINPDCKVTSVKDSADILTITLNRNFMDWSFLGVKDDAEVARLKNLAVSSIVNSLVEATGYSKIQLLVDKENIGVGTRLLAKEIGMVGEADEVLGPIGWRGDIILDAERTVSVLLSSIQKGDVDVAYSLIAYFDKEQAPKPSTNSFEQVLKEMPVIEGYQIFGFSPNPQNKHCRVIVSYVLRTDDARTLTRESVPVELVRENDVWKMKYSEFESLFVNVAEE